MRTRIALGAAGVAALTAVGTPAVAGAATGSAPGTGSTAGAHRGLPVSRMENIVQADGTVSSGVLDIAVSRPDLHVTGGRPAVPFATGFQIEGDFTFQALGPGRAIMNADMALRPAEIQPFIKTLLARRVVFQAEHQHLYNLSPMVWFVHFRKVGDPLELARDAHALIKVTATPLPQHSPAHPTTPLPAKRLGRILGGDAQVGENGVVTVSVPRRHGVVLGGVRVSPELNIATVVQFEPLGGGRAAAVPDFSMTASQVQPVIKVMRSHGWEIGCLYNQETAESPQLYFSHTFKTGDPIELAHQVRAGLDRTDAVPAS